MKQIRNILTAVTSDWLTNVKVAIVEVAITDNHSRTCNTRPNGGITDN